MRNDRHLKQALLTLVICWACTASFAIAQREKITDGGFENTVLGGSTSGAELVCPGTWCFKDSDSRGNVDLVMDPVNGGDIAAQVDTVGARNGNILYQDFAELPPCFVLTASVHRTSGTHNILLFSNWDRAELAAIEAVSAISMNDNGIGLTAWGEALGQSVDTVLGPEWNEIRVAVDASVGTQTLSINGTEVAEFTGEPQALAKQAEATLLMGDTAGSARQGLFVYDDVSIQTTSCADQAACLCEDDGRVSISELIRGVGYALRGCPDAE